jgi:1,5-anhydro-D-fructose reductase (1,5-anhydro-D-mannitol-forming)
MKTIRWGIIGCGEVTEVKSGPGFAKAERSALVAVMRRNGELARDYARRHGVARWYDDGAALIADPEVDAVYVATPPSAHKEYTIAAAAAGKPVYVEKPMALNAGECDAMIAACRAAGVPLFVAYYRRALPRFLKVKELIDSGAIGDVRAVTIALYRRYEPPVPAVPPAGASAAVGGSAAPAALPWRIDPAISGGGLFVDLAAHTFDLLDYVLGPIARVTGGAGNQAGRYAAEDIVHGAFEFARDDKSRRGELAWQGGRRPPCEEFASGVRGTGIWAFDAFGDVDRTEIVGSRGRVSFATFDDLPVTLETAAGTQVFTIPHPAHVHQPLIQTIVDELTGHGAAPCPSTGESGARTTRVMDELLRAYYQRQR